MKDNGDYSELIEYLDEKFQNTATKKDLERFATKKDLEHFATKSEFGMLKKDLSGLREEFDKFKDESLTNQDATLKKLDILLDEKDVAVYQRRQDKKLWLIVLRALKKNRILTPADTKQISGLEIF